MADTQYDVAVIGAGPGGYVAAIRASQLGMKAAVIERGELGGVCLNVGCIPTKALLHSAELLDEAREGKRVGVVADNVRVDWTGVMGHKERVVKQMTGGVGGLMKKNKIDVIRGFGKLAGPNSVLVSGDGGDQTVQARNIIVATGSAPKGLPFAPIDEEMILSSTGALALKEIPRRMVIIGGGVIGCELASAYRSFGAEVTIVEALPGLSQPKMRRSAPSWRRLSIAAVSRHSWARRSPESTAVKTASWSPIPIRRAKNNSSRAISCCWPSDADL